MILLVLLTSTIIYSLLHLSEPFPDVLCHLSSIEATSNNGLIAYLNF